MMAIVEHCRRKTQKVRVLKSEEWPRIGQETIVYGRAMLDSFVDDGLERRDSSEVDGNWVTTLTDSVRVSEDCGRFHAQFEFGEVWVGMHGSFVVIANWVEREIRFDHGVEGGIE